MYLAAGSNGGFESCNSGRINENNFTRQHEGKKWLWLAYELGLIGTDYRVIWYGIVITIIAGLRYEQLMRNLIFAAYAWRSVKVNKKMQDTYEWAMCNFNKWQ